MFLVMGDTSSYRMLGPREFPALVISLVGFVFLLFASIFPFLSSRDLLENFIVVFLVFYKFCFDYAVLLSFLTGCLGNPT